MENSDETHAINGSFVSQLSPLTGLVQWNLVDDEYAFQQEIARSAYADMLHDSNRNRRYNEAICHVMHELKSKTPLQPIHVLDIGTGTGILSMMAARAGADFVTACEAFTPVARCAEQIVAANGLSERIHVVSKRSTDLIVGEDMPQRANVLVAELLDTELIGEGALETYRHAVDHLLTPDAVLIPCKARLYMQVIESPFIWSHNKLRPICLDDSILSVEPVFPNAEMISCSGCPSVFDLQVSQLQVVEDLGTKETNTCGQIRCLLDEPLCFHEFNFGPPSSAIKLREHRRITDSKGRRLVSRVDGTVHAVVVWWDVQMETSDQIARISIAPLWADPENAVWREHWMQAVYFPRSPVYLCKGQPFAVDFAHDEVSMWFDIVDASVPPPAAAIHRPVCSCYAHMAWPRSRFAELNSSAYWKRVGAIARTAAHSVKDSLKTDLVIVIPSDASLLALALYEATRNFPRNRLYIFHLDCSPLSARLMKSVYSRVPSCNITIFESVENLISRLRELTTVYNAFILAEPFVLAAALPWNSIHFWYILAKMTSELPNINTRLLSPTRLRIWAVAVDFDNLWKIRAPVGADCEGFDLRLFDNLVLSAANNTDVLIEPQPLWEYPGFARSVPQIVLDFSLTRAPNLTKHSQMPHWTFADKLGANLTLSTQNVNGIAFWAEWLTASLDESAVWVSVAGPACPIKVNERIEWTKASPQSGVMILSDCLKKSAVRQFPCSLRVNADFDLVAGEPVFDVKLQSA